VIETHGQAGGSKEWLKASSRGIWLAGWRWEIFKQEHLVTCKAWDFFPVGISTPITTCIQGNELLRFHSAKRTFGGIIVE
jgi:hypothetical protein